MDGDLLGRHYKEDLSDFPTWPQREHATEWILEPQNMGKSLSIDETSLGDVVTILSNKAGKGRWGDSHSNSAGDGMNAIMAAFTGHPSLKHVIVVDEDIDIFDDRQVEWAVATRFQADRMLRIPGAAGSSLDPSAEGTTWKLGIDATIPLRMDRKLFTKATLD